MQLKKFCVANQRVIDDSTSRWKWKPAPARLTVGVDSVIELKDANQFSGTLKNGDDLFSLSKQSEIYRDGFIVNELNSEGEVSSPLPTM